ncbi:MAG: hypothetical protein ACFFB2_06210 [Promethearchaeota archaeon]
MEETSQLISSFVRSLETHPHGKEIITIVEEILADDSGVVPPSLLASLKQLSDNNMSLLIDFWLLRGSILKEEGREAEAVRLFFEAIQWAPDQETTWLRIVDIYKGHEEFFKAVFFLVEGQKRLDPPNSLTDKLALLMPQLEVQLTAPPGTNNLLCVDTPATFVSDTPSPVPKEPLQISSEASDLWTQALECFEEGTQGDNLIYLQAFIHFAHSTVREVLGLDGTFEVGLDHKIAQYGLFEFKRFFSRLNSLRNTVIHHEYLVSKEEAIDIHRHVLDFLSFMQQK